MKIRGRTLRFFFATLACFPFLSWLDGCLFGGVDPNKKNIPPAGMTLIPSLGRAFSMGQEGLAEPVHQVSFTYDFYMDSVEVTQADYRALMDTNPSYFRDDTRPVERVTWFDAVLYCNERSKRDGFDTVYSYAGISAPLENGTDSLLGLAMDYSKKGYRLPTEAEWEYACRGGTQTVYFWGEATDSVDAYAWYSANSSDSTHPVGGKRANAYGMRDMAGNVYEWIADRYGEYSPGSQSDPKGSDTGSVRALRGGCWFNVPEIFRSAYRGKDPPTERNHDVGFRCVIMR